MHSAARRESICNSASHASVLPAVACREPVSCVRLDEPTEFIEVGRIVERFKRREKCGRSLATLVGSERNNSETSTPSDRASRSMLSIGHFLSPRSTDPMYVRWRPEVAPNASWEIPRRLRIRRRVLLQIGAEAMTVLSASMQGVFLMPLRRQTFK